MKTLLVLLGPTAVGKTELSLKLAEHYHSPILSVDSRQLYKGLEIGTAAATQEQKARVEHHFVGILDIDKYYSVSDYEAHAISLLQELFTKHDIIVATGGSMLYVDALCYGIDQLPAIDSELRKELYETYESQGLAPILEKLKLLDPIYYNEVDQKNYKRVIHALEVCLMTGKPYSSFRTHSKKKRPFNIIRIGLERDRDELYERINKRVDCMIEAGLVEEAKSFYPLKHLNALNTVGYKEIFKHLDQEWTLEFACDKIKQNTRIYSRQQMRWFKKDEHTHWFNLSQENEDKIFLDIISLIDSNNQE